MAEIKAVRSFFLFLKSIYCLLLLFIFPQHIQVMSSWMKYEQFSVICKVYFQNVIIVCLQAHDDLSLEHNKTRFQKWWKKTKSKRQPTDSKINSWYRFLLYFHLAHNEASSNKEEVEDSEKVRQKIPDDCFIVVVQFDNVVLCIHFSI